MSLQEQKVGDRMYSCETGSTGERNLSERQRGLLEAGLDVKYLIMERCRAGILQQRNTSALEAMIPGRQATK